MPIEFVDEDGVVVAVDYYDELEITQILMEFCLLKALEEEA